MSWHHKLASRGRSLGIVGALALVSLGMAACERSAAPPPAREGFALTDKFFDVKSLANDTFLLLGYRSALSRSDDGGVHWKTLPAPTRRSLTRLAFVDGKVGWGVGHEGIVYKTENGGDAWKEQQSTTKNALFSLSITSPTSLWAVGDVSTVVHTTDGGNTWSAN